MAAEEPKRSMGSKVTIIAFAVVLLVAGGVAFALTWNPGAVEVDDLLDHYTFRCYTVSETARTVGANRGERKRAQITRVERLLLQAKLEPMDHAKLKSERAVLLWDVADSRFQTDCAESYFEPGRAALRESFTNTPKTLSTQAARVAFEEALAEVAPRLWPHGFEDRARMHIAEAALEAGEYDLAIQKAQAMLDVKPQGLHSDTIKLVMADALAAKGRTEEALALYTDVGRLKIGFEAHYARYRQGAILKRMGETDEGEELLADVIKWAERGERDALVNVLKGIEPIPPAPE